MTSTTGQGGAAPAETGPKPDSPDDLKKPSWSYVLRRTVAEFSKDQCPDLAAALTHYAMLALFPALLALLSLVGLVGQGPTTASTIIDVIRTAGVRSSALETTVTQLSSTSGAGITFVVGLATALWSASGYVNSFSRAMNRIYEVEEGRPVWKLRPAMLLITLASVLLAAAVLVGLVLSGPAARAVGTAIGLGSTAVLVWNIAKWPVILAIVVLLVALLYYTTPNVKQPRFRWMSVGALLAIVTWLLASAAFALYLATFASYARTYGALTGVIVFLLWLWITNLALLLGAELDAEMERGRELQAGIAAEERVQLPLRDTRASDKAESKRRKVVARGRRLRTSRGESQDVEGDGSSR